MCHNILKNAPYMPFLTECFFLFFIYNVFLELIRLIYAVME
jgi:hypothetical protein